VPPPTLPRPVIASATCVFTAAPPIPPPEPPFPGGLAMLFTPPPPPPATIYLNAGVPDDVIDDGEPILALEPTATPVLPAPTLTVYVFDLYNEKLETETPPAPPPPKRVAPPPPPTIKVSTPTVVDTVVPEDTCMFFPVILLVDAFLIDINKSLSQMQ
jgi:hypothetical protein